MESRVYATIWPSKRKEETFCERGYHCFPHILGSQSHEDSVVHTTMSQANLNASKEFNILHQVRVVQQLRLHTKWKPAHPHDDLLCYLPFVIRWTLCKMEARKYITVLNRSSNRQRSLSSSFLGRLDLVSLWEFPELVQWASSELFVGSSKHLCTFVLLSLRL